MKNDELSYNLGDTVDRLISVQYFMSGGGSALTQKPVTGVLYEAAREKAGAPLCHLAAKALADKTRPYVLNLLLDPADRSPAMSRLARRLAKRLSTDRP